MIEYSSIFYRHKGYRENAAIDPDGHVNLRALGCPDHIARRIEEQRAKKLGRTTREAAVPSDLEADIQASKLF